MKTRRNYDFSKHTHRVEMFTSSEGNEIRVDHFQVADKRCGYIKFVNDEQGYLFLEILETGYFADPLFLHQRVLFLMGIGTKN